MLERFPSAYVSQRMCSRFFAWDVIYYPEQQWGAFFYVYVPEWAFVQSLFAHIINVSLKTTENAHLGMLLCRGTLREVTCTIDKKCKQRTINSVSESLIWLISCFCAHGLPRLTFLYYRMRWQCLASEHAFAHSHRQLKTAEYSRRQDGRIVIIYIKLREANQRDEHDVLLSIELHYECSQHVYFIYRRRKVAHETGPMCFQCLLHWFFTRPR